MNDLPQTIAEAAEEAGIRRYDTDLPRTFSEEYRRHWGDSPAGSVVWSFDPPFDIFGAPAGLTAQARDRLRVMRDRGLA